MTANWHFNVDDKVWFIFKRGSKATMAPLGTLTTWSSRVEISTTFTYEQLKRAGAGRIRVKADGSLTMTSDPLG